MSGFAIAPDHDRSYGWLLWGIEIGEPWRGVKAQVSAWLAYGLGGKFMDRYVDSL